MGTIQLAAAMYLHQRDRIGLVLDAVEFAQRLCDLLT